MTPVFIVFLFALADIHMGALGTLCVYLLLKSFYLFFRFAFCHMYTFLSGRIPLTGIYGKIIYPHGVFVKPEEKPCAKCAGQFISFYAFR